MSLKTGYVSEKIGEFELIPEICEERPRCRLERRSTTRWNQKTIRMMVNHHYDGSRPRSLHRLISLSHTLLNQMSGKSMH